jgi:MerR family transcriptional regulator, light-induced transcriptional regulator
VPDSCRCKRAPILHDATQRLRESGPASIPGVVSAIRTNAAAAMLGVSPNTLRSWERRFGFPSPRRSAGGHRQFELAEIDALRQALDETHNVSSAISIARERGTGPSSPMRLRSLLARFDEDAADRLLEESLAVRSVERTVEEILLPAIGSLGQGGDRLSPEYGFGWRWATGWLAAQMRTAPPAHRDEGVFVIDATRPLDLDALHAQSLELVLRRAGVRTLALPIDLDPLRIGRALVALQPSSVVLVGRHATLDTFGRLVYASRRAGTEVTVYDFRGALPHSGASTVPRLGERPLAARERLLADLDTAARDAARRATG